MQESTGKRGAGEGEAYPRGGLAGLMVGASCPGISMGQLGLPGPLPIQPQLAHTFPLDLMMSLLAPWG